MPYFQRAWNQVLDKSGKKQDKNLRQAPHGENAEPVQTTPPKPVDIDKTRVLYKHQMLQKQVDDINKAVASHPTKDNKDFSKYTINTNAVIFKGQHSSLYEASNPQYGESTIVACRIFEPSARIDPNNDHYLKTLSHLGKKHPNIIATMDIFADDQKHVILFQEYANHGNALEYLRAGKIVTEQAMNHWAQGIYRGLDYLGDVGISHRAIQPKHILLKGTSNEPVEMQAKLGGFRSSIIYWDSSNSDIHDQACRPVEKRAYANFQAPEVFGNSNEFYNPIEADVWSYGATMFYLVSRQYPFNPSKPGEKLDEEIKRTVMGCRKLSDPAKQWCYGMLRANTHDRTGFDEIENNQWFKSG